ncbi:hypothetical protein [Actinoplanes sp. TFC3]|uniref:hypothetical protein n=1 Tax=Actinoplanes sp. TFC3 TaxID=1710355 RepID=UPI000A882E09|nr:hypothetical protein [Actinoplanes sp. TFC3]
MTDATAPDPAPPERQIPLSDQDLAEGEQYATDHDPGPAEDYAGDPVPDPWEEDTP